MIIKSKVIDIVNVSKEYNIASRKKGIIKNVKLFLKPEYYQIPALKNINLSIYKGEMVGIVGLNGAGKTTLMKMIAGLIYPTSGSVSVMGKNPEVHNKMFLNELGFVMGQRSQLWWDLSAIDSYRLEQAVYNICNVDFDNIVNIMSNLLGVKEFLDIPVRKLSLGQRMKLELICVLLHYPSLLLLDEPTIGLDVISKKSIQFFLRQFNADRNTTILVTSHNMDDIESICNRIVILNSGKILYDGLLEQLKRRFCHKILYTVYSKKEKKQSIGDIKIVHEASDYFSFIADNKNNKISRMLEEKKLFYDKRNLDLEEIIELIFEDK